MLDAIMKQMGSGGMMKGVENIAAQFQALNANMATVIEQQRQIIALLQAQQKELETWKVNRAA